MQGGVNIKKDENENNISKQMNTWALLSNWSQDEFHNEPLVNVFEFSEISSWLQLCPSRKLPFFYGNPSLIYLYTNRPFGFSAHSSLFLGCPFFYFLFIFSFFLLFHCAFKNLNFVQNEWKFFYFPKEENSLAQVPVFDPNELLKYVT